MEESKILCNNCNNEIVQYFDAKYSGNRGKCTTCKIDFPLE